MNTLFMGVDPGQSGGIAVLSGNGNVRPPETTAMPDTEKDVWNWIGCFHNVRGVFAVIEKVHAMPGNGVSSMFKFGKGYGGLRMALVAAGIPFEEVSPQKWMKELGITKRGGGESKTEFKNRLKAKAQQLFPSETVTLAVADALLIAEYARRTHGRE